VFKDKINPAHTNPVAEWWILSEVEVSYEFKPKGISQEGYQLFLVLSL
jgi:hypothetical protein